MGGQFGMADYDTEFTTENVSRDFLKKKDE